MAVRVYRIVYLVRLVPINHYQEHHHVCFVLLVHPIPLPVNQFAVLAILVVIRTLADKLIAIHVQQDHRRERMDRAAVYFVLLDHLLEQKDKLHALCAKKVLYHH